MEDITTSSLPDHAGEAARLAVLSDLDQLPVGVREEWGRLLLDMLDDVTQASEEEAMWRFRRQLNADATRQTVYACATRFDEQTQALFRSYAQLRHHEVAERVGRPDGLVTVGVLLTPNYSGSRPWDTTMIRIHGPSTLTEEEAAEFDEAWKISAATA